MSVLENFPHISQNVTIAPSVKIIGDVYIGDHAEIKDNVILSGAKGRLVIGSEVSIGSETEIYSTKERIFIGNKVKIGKNCIIEGQIGDNSVIEDNVKISNSVKIGKNCTIKANQELSDVEVSDGESVTDSKIE